MEGLAAWHELEGLQKETKIEKQLVWYVLVVRHDACKQQMIVIHRNVKFTFT